ncbi:MAG: flavin reductase [Flavobacteriaceae bacterium]|nr:flavin reductase [Flavobacteriaceae bacterium]NNL78881.1 flavin reductase [Flavobacteriaceae bacterium]
MIHFDRKDVDKMPYVFRINLMNSVSGYKSANLIGTKSKSGHPNLAVFSSITHIGSNPPLLGFFMRPTTEIRNTYENILETGTYTVNHIHSSIIEEAHHTSAKYERGISEFDQSGLKELYREDFSAPYVLGTPVQLGLSFVEEHPIKANGTILIIGRVEHVYIDDHLFRSDGFIDLTEGQIATINGLDAYAVPETNNRLSYQRPKPISSFI